MEREIKAGMKVRHFKGFISEIIAVAMHTETEEELVIYKHIDEEQVYARPLSMFNSLVDKEKYPNVTQKYRFEIIGG
jgi:hypothetical protein